LLFVRTMLGMDAQHGRINLDAQIPEQIGRIQLTGVYGFGKLWDIEAVGTQAYVRLSSSPAEEY
jgi:hypothetical protein